MKIIRTTQLVKKIALSRSTIWRMEKIGQFPHRIKLSDKAVGYDERAIEDWLAARQGSRA